MTKGVPFQNLSLSEALTALAVDPDHGLSDEAVRQRQLKYGLNEIPQKEQPLATRIAKRFWGPIPWMIEMAAILSAAVQKWEDLAIISVLLLVNVAIDFRQEASR